MGCSGGGRGYRLSVESAINPRVIWTVELTVVDQGLLDHTLDSIVDGVNLLFHDGLGDGHDTWQGEWARVLTLRCRTFFDDL